MDYIEDDFTDALIDAICEKSPSTWYTLIGENFEDAFNESKDDFDLLYVMNLMQHVPKALNLSGSK